MTQITIKREDRESLMATSTVAALFSNAKCPVCGNAVGNSTTLEPTVFGDQAFGLTYKGYSVTCSACCAVLGVLPDADDIASAVVAKLSE
jgi:hypothetical protein